MYRYNIHTCIQEYVRLGGFRHWPPGDYLMMLSFIFVHFLRTRLAYNLSQGIYMSYIPKQ